MKHASWSETEKLMIQEWLLIIQRDYRIYNIDTTHQCMKETDRSSIIQVFKDVGNFHGCIRCGQFHICHMDGRDCIVHTDTIAQRLTCMFSGYLLKESVSYVAPVMTQYTDLSQSVDNTSRKSRDSFKKKKSLYTNIKLPLTLEDEENQYQEEYHDDSVDKNDSCTDDEKSVESDSQKSEDDDDESCIHGVNQKFCNRTYWDNYYSFIADTNNNIGSIDTGEKTRDIQQCRFDVNILKPESKNELTNRINLLIDTLLPTHDTTNRLLKEVIITYYMQIICNIASLVYNRSSTLTPSEICDAIMFNLLLESYYGEDSLGFRVELWSYDVWLRELYQNNALGCIFLEKKTKRRKKGSSVKKQASLNINKKRMDAAAIDIKSIVSSFAEINVQWTRNFILHGLSDYYG